MKNLMKNYYEKYKENIIINKKENMIAVVNLKKKCHGIESW